MQPETRITPSSRFHNLIGIGLVALSTTVAISATQSSSATNATSSWPASPMPLSSEPRQPHSLDMSLSVPKLAIDLLYAFSSTQQSQLQHDIRALALPESRSGLRAATYPINTQDMSPAQLHATERLLKASLKQHANSRPLSVLDAQKALALDDDQDLSKRPYAISIQGSPSQKTPWAWQIGLESKAIRFFYFGDYFSMSEQLIGYESI